MNTIPILFLVGFIPLCGPLFQFAQAQAPRGKEAEKGRALTVDLPEVGKLLNETLETKDFQNPMTLKEIVGHLQERFQSKGKDLTIFVDVEAFLEEDPDQGDVYDMPIKFPPFPSKMTTGKALDLIVSRMGVAGATFLLRRGTVEITTRKAAQVSRLLRQKIVASFSRIPLSEALFQLADYSGVSIILDPRLGDSSQTPVSAVFRHDVSLDSAARMLVDMAGLKVSVLESGLNVTTPENAREVERERKQRQKEAQDMRPREGKGNNKDG